MVTVLGLVDPAPDDFGLVSAPIGAGRVERARWDREAQEAWVLLHSHALVRVRVR